MKNILIIAGSALGLAVLVGFSALAWKAFTITDPYLVKPLKCAPAPVGATVGDSITSGSHSLSVISSNDVVVVVDPGVSFLYEVVWLVERPRRDGKHTLLEFKCELPQHAEGHIKPLGSHIPAKIRRVADESLWWHGL